MGLQSCGNDVNHVLGHSCDSSRSVGVTWCQPPAFSSGRCVSYGSVVYNITNKRKIAHSVNIFCLCHADITEKCKCNKILLLSNYIFRKLYEIEANPTSLADSTYGIRLLTPICKSIKIQKSTHLLQVRVAQKCSVCLSLSYPKRSFNWVN